MVVGVVLFAASIFILVQSWRHRDSTERLPLPALLIVFGLIFDLTIAVGRSGAGVAEAVSFNRYVMANLILLTGIVIWALARNATRRPPRTSGPWRVFGTYLIISAFAIFLVVQVTDATAVGVTYGRSDAMPCGSLLRERS